MSLMLINHFYAVGHCEWGNRVNTFNHPKRCMKKIITLSNHARKCLFAKAFDHACRLVLQKKMLLTGILLTNVLIASFSQRSSGLLSSYESCHVQPPQQQEQTSFTIQAAGMAPMLRVAYVIPLIQTWNTIEMNATPPNTNVTLSSQVEVDALPVQK